MKSNIISISVLGILLFCLSCKNDDEGFIQQISAPTVLLPNANITATFFTEGQTEAPIINWNGSTGVFSIASNIIGISVNENTGIISWDKSLLLGSNTIELVATNSAGQTSVNVMIDNNFSGNFEGSYNLDPNSTTTPTPFAMNFNEDGTMVAIGTSEAPGTWTMSGNTITSLYVTVSGSDHIAVVDLIYSDTEATLTGLFSNGTTLSDPAAGYMALAIQ